MKRFKKIYPLMALALTLGLTGCIKEVEPESGIATAKQVGESATAFEASMRGIPSQMAQGYLIYGNQTHEIDMAYPGLMIDQSELLGDLLPLGNNSGYDWYRNFNCDQGLGENTYYSYVPWRTLYMFVKSANDVIASAQSGSETVQQMAGSAYADRAFAYLMLMYFFEPVQNVYTDVSSVLGLTVPIVSDSTTGDVGRNNPRVSHDAMMQFVLSDLDQAETRLANYSPSDKTLPDLSVVYGLKAKAYLWDKDYANAARYARLAIDTNGGSPMTEDQWTNPTTGFTTATSGWMWYIHYDAENMGNLCNYVGWVSSESDWGYASLTCPGIDANLYNHMNKSDFRKHVFLDPDKYSYYDYQTCRDADFINDAPAYLSLKFRCKSGDYENYATGGAIDVPVMRIEEMYLIEALATGASQGVDAGIALLNSFMQTYRDPGYHFRSSDLQAFEFEVLAQMRIEFWGEGNAFPVAKMLGGRELFNGQPAVVQNYDGTNATENRFKINCQGIKPSWTLMIPISEVQANQALVGKNNPDPTQKVIGPTAIGTLAAGNN